MVLDFHNYTSNLTMDVTNKIENTTLQVK